MQSKEFVLSALALIALTVLFAIGRIGADLFTSLLSGIVGTYAISRGLAKTEVRGPDGR